MNTPQPWLGDACSLVDALRAGTITPTEALDACLDAIDASTLNAFSYLDPSGARRRAKRADVSLPFGGLPVGVKELDAVEGWPETEASLVYRDRKATHHSIQIERLEAAGANFVGLTTASEFGFVAYTATKLNGVTRNPWNPALTPGGSSGGSAAAVAGGLVPIATGGDGGGSIRKPASYTGLLGLKGTFGRIPRGPRSGTEPLTVSIGCLARSVRDVARWLDVCNGFDRRDRFSLPRVDGWEAGLGAIDLTGVRAAITPTLFGNAVVHPAIVERIHEAGEWLVKTTGMQLVEVDGHLPAPGLEWGAAGLVDLATEFGDISEEERDLLTDELKLGMMFLDAYNIEVAVGVQRYRTELVAAMADIFSETDVVISATNAAPPFAAEGPTPHMVGDQFVTPFNDGALTIPGNLSHQPAISIPLEPGADGLPLGLQVTARRLDEALLLDLALAVERERPWPLVAPSAPI